MPFELCFCLETRPDFWENPTVSMGLGPLQSVCQAVGDSEPVMSVNRLQSNLLPPKKRVLFGGQNHAKSNQNRDLPFFGAKNSGELVENSGELARVLGLEIPSRKKLIVRT